MSKLFGPFPTAIDGEAANLGLESIEQDFIVGESDARLLVLKGIARAEATGDIDKALSLRKCWHVNEQHLFRKVRPSAGDTSINVCVDLAFAASTASHRAANVIRNMVCIVAAEYLADPWDQDGFSDADPNRSCLSAGAFP